MRFVPPSWPLRICLLSACLLLAVAAPVRAGEATPLRAVAPGETGLGADLLRELTHDLGAGLEFLPCAGDACRAALERGDADLGAGLAERAGDSGVRLLRPAYALRAGATLYRLRGARPVRELRELLGRRLGLVRGTVLPGPLADEHRIALIRQNGPERLLALLLAGTVDVVLLDPDTGAAILRKQGLERRIVPCVWIPGGTTPLFLGISLRSRLLPRAGELEHRLRGMVESGRLRELQQRHAHGAESE